MSSIRSKDTRPELALRKELWHRGLRFQKNSKGLPGKPDIVFSRARLAVFCDGDFWHGHNWAIRGYGSLENELQRYSKAWGDKITRNIQRDARTNKELEGLGWNVLRIWESDIKTDVKRCGDIVEYAYWDIMRNSFADEKDFDEDV
jgi:DNA mismatch endonuclease (patch repair protein)